MAEALRTWQGRRLVAWGRLYVGLIVAGLLVVLARVAQLEVNPDPRLAAAAGTVTSVRPVAAWRGRLLDRRGRPLAVTTTGYRLFVDPREVADLATVAVDLAAIIGGDPTVIDRRLSARPDSRYVVIDDLLAPGKVQAVRRARLRGVGLERRPVREYPADPAAAAIVGAVGRDQSGLSGMELRFEPRMAASRGSLRYVRDARRHALWIQPRASRRGRDGRDVRLSIDLVVQRIAEAALGEAVSAYNAGGGRIVVADCRTGELLALHDVIHERPGWDEPIRDPARARRPGLGRNRCVTDPYEPGSTFKPFVWAWATAHGFADPEEVLPTPGDGPYRTPYGRWIRDAHYYGPSTWRTVLVKSMNSGMAIVAGRMSHEDLRRAVRGFGFGERTRCGLPGESPGIVTAPGAWSNYTQSSVSFGHEISVTPVQMARAFCAFARDGTLPPLRLAAVSEDDRGYRFVRRAIPAPVARLTRAILREVMTEGTGRRANSRRYRLFGKSGTAQLPRAGGGGYYEDRYVSSFIAGAPYLDPRVVVLCVIDDPDRRRGHYGGAIAGPVVRDVIDATLTYLGVPPDRGPDRPPGALARGG